MTGFFSALIDRADGRLPVLERRPRSMFEPQAPAPGTLAQEVVEVAAAQSAQPPREQHPGRGEPAAPPALSASADAITLLQPRTWRDGAVRERDAAAFDNADESVAVRRAGTAAQLPVPASPEPAAPIAVWRDPRAQRTPSGLDTPVPSAVPSAREHDEPAPMRAAQVSNRDMPCPAPGAAAAREHDPPPAGVLKPERAPAPPAVRLARSQAAPVREAAPAAAAPAPVHLSIGRVEIRAAAAAPEKPRARGPAAPRLSLDEYLRQRNGAVR